MAVMVPGRPAQHALGVCTDGQNLAAARIDGHHRRLGKDDAPAAHVHKRGGGAQIHCHIASGETGDVLGKGDDTTSARLAIILHSCAVEARRVLYPGPSHQVEPLIAEHAGQKTQRKPHHVAVLTV